MNLSQAQSITWVPFVPYAPRQLTPYDAIYRMVVAEIEKLISQETYDEKSHEEEVMQAVARQLNISFDAVSAWAEAFIDAAYHSKKWSDEQAMKFLFDGDDMALGQMMREASIASLAADIFRIAENEILG